MKESIYNSSFEELKSFFIDLNEKAFRAEQLWNWLYVKGVNELELINNISTTVIKKVASKYHISHLNVNKRVISKDGTRKWLLKLEDGKEIETVYIPDSNRGTICVSSQVGCTLSCSFCHTGTMNYIRNLNMSEILGQVIFVKNELKDWNYKVEKKKLTNIVFMGMGEPFFNYDNVIKAINILTDEKGLAFSKRKITLSTSGVVPKILDFKEDSDVNLAISLHAAFDEVRDILVPLNRKWPIQVLLKALKEYSKKRSNKRITFEYIMLDGINDSIKDAQELIKLIKPFRAKINLIPFNSWPGSNYKASSMHQIQIFKKFILEKGKLVATVRLPRGDDVLAACGQLKSF
ncbi:MAG: 23S rRNA (adenine(2503)-C(2))-methyltransferase RlmN [Pelagibacterales bacterium]|nr:23S rRNA (adenine(2503)-C(2))-methyltransferase RlmN [Pelagibacterales bacterium]OUU61558.1 MAG: 23S rRNA (adenine(2503)-C(2))-methyltransferase [Alphaproteobacteria bacterium TMED62]